jgi:transcription elongation factor GreB
MSKAFTKDDDGAEAAPVPPRAPLPDGVPNYVTPRGLRLLHEEAASLEAERAAAEAGLRDPHERRRATAYVSARAAQLAERIASAVLVEPPAETPAEARFGATVTVRDEQGEQRRYRIVGVDEADPARGDVAFTSPIARALLGAQPGDEVTVTLPRGQQSLEIVSIE